MKTSYFSAAALVCALAFTAPALAQEHKMMKHDAMAMQPTGDQGPSSKAFAQANSKMHKDMSIKFSGDADKDFVRGMVAHHQGAIDMAKVELKYGKDEACDRYHRRAGRRNQADEGLAGQTWRLNRRAIHKSCEKITRRVKAAGNSTSVQCVSGGVVMLHFIGGRAFLQAQFP
jgi:hypothetical protein